SNDSRPLMQRRIVLLPEPDGPMSTATLPPSRPSDTPRSTSRSRNRLTSCEIVSICNSERSIPLSHFCRREEAKPRVNALRLSILHPPSSVLHPLSSILYPLSSSVPFYRLSTQPASTNQA